MSDRVYLKPADLDRLAEVVLELAQQLHVERARRIALEQALAARGLLDAASIDAASRTPAGRTEAQRQLDAALERIVRIMSASGGPEAPLR